MKQERRRSFDNNRMYFSACGDFRIEFRRDKMQESKPEF
jgi:hypothetical protein